MKASQHIMADITKQFIRGKTIRFGFKLWCLSSSDEYLDYAEFYCGSDTSLNETGLR